MAQAIPAIIAVVGAAASYSNTQSTARKQDNAAARSIRNQGKKQAELDARVNQEVQSLQGSNAADERAKALTNYTDTVRKGSGDITAGLTPGIGSQAFQDSGQKAAAGTLDYANNIAGLMSRIDAPTMQRRGEAFGYGRLATDTNMLSREARGQAFLDQLRLSAIRRNPLLDAFSAAASSYGGGAGSGSAGGSGGGVPLGDWNMGSTIGATA